ncbi:MAG: DUF3368 domain-containing protein [Verrucomicrobiae bacterium]|nr:DUF3368 domain-containing protein [Verrucomicrobiae bacterium]
MEAISNTSPILYLYRIGHLNLLTRLFDRVFTTRGVLDELQKGATQGYDVPCAESLQSFIVENNLDENWEWLAVDLGLGELSCLSLAIDNPSRIIILDDLQARRVAHAAGLQVWGTLRVILEAKNKGFIESVAPLIGLLSDSGMWISAQVRARIMTLACENE